MSYTPIRLTNVEQSSCFKAKDEQSSIEQSTEHEQSSINVAANNMIFTLTVEQSSIPEPKQELSSISNPDIDEKTGTKFYKQEQSSISVDFDPHTHVHGGSSNNKNILINTLDLEEEKKEKEKNNPLPPDKKETEKKEEGILAVEAEEVPAEAPPETVKPKRKSKPKAQPDLSPPEHWEISTKLALGEWLKYKTGRKDFYQDVGLAMLYQRLDKFPQKTIVAAVEIAISNNWKGVFPEKVTQTKPTLQQSSLQALKQNIEQNGIELNETIHPSLASWN